MKKTLLAAAVLVLGITASAQNTRRWSEEKASAWFEEQGWMSGCDYIPAYAVNQLEMWQADTFNPAEIDKELGWAEDLGFNIMRVFLHHLLWETDRDGLVERMNRYLDISSSHGIRTMFVFLDDCWEVTAAPGKQPAPRKGVHNSGWLSDPGALYFAQDGKSWAEDTTTIVNLLEKYVKDILTEFKDDDRIAYWDLYNEPGGGPAHCYRYRSLPLLKDVFRWASEVRPSQPLTSGIWSGLLGEMNMFQINNSDIVSYHTYEPLESHEHLLDTLVRHGRPMVCTEYMARTQKSTFQAIMPMLRERNVVAINWGFVAGKTNTIFPWESPEGGEEPELWFHDVLRPDGTPYSEDEAKVIKAVNGKTAQINVIPYPQEVSMGQGFCDVKGAKISVARSLRSWSTNDFADKFEASSGKGGGGRIVFRRDRTLGCDEYTIEVKPRKVIVKASSPEGARYAVSTLCQMLPVEIYSGKAAPSRWELPVCWIKDAPKFGHRGVLLDCSRHFFSVDEVKRFLDIMSVYKMNRFHWHLTDDHGWRFESKKYPRLTEVGSVRPGSMKGWDAVNLDMTPYGGYYTQDQMREVVAYAKDRGIEIVPEIDLPAHLVSALKAYPELGCTGGPYECMIVWDIAKDVLCAGKESSFEFLEDIFTELCDIFPYEYVHIGGDECPKTRWEQCPACQAKIAQLGLTDTDKGTAEQYLQNYVTARVQKILADKGRKVIGWDEILEGELAPGATIMSWRGTEGGIKASNAGFDVIMTPVEYCYLDMRYADSPDEPEGPARTLPLEKCYSFNPVEGLDEEAASHVLGLQGNVWGEFIPTPEHAEYMLLPRMLALSEVAWGTADDYTRFHNSVISRQERIFRQMGYNHRTEWDCCPKGRETIPVISWHGLAKDAFAKGLPLVKEAGFDIYLHRVDNLDSALVMLDLCQRNGLMAMPQCPELLAEPERVVPLIRNHPALYAYYLKDEPEYWDLEWLGGIVKRIQAIDKDVPCYINLYPNWAWEEEKYVDHINMFADNCPTPMVSFDQYPLTEVDGEIVVRDTWYRNLEEIRTLCRERNLPMWAFSLLQSHHLGAPSPVAFYPVPSIGHLRLQVFSDLAYGAQVIQFFTCRGAIDANCAKTAEFGITQQIISEIKSLSPVFLGCEVEDVWHLGELPKGTEPFDASFVNKVRKVSSDGKGVVISHLRNGRGEYLAIVNKDCVNSQTLNISFKGKVRKVAKDCTLSVFDGKPVVLEPGDMLVFKLN